MLTDAAVVIGSNAIAAAITHGQAHSADPGAAGTTGVIGSRVAAGKSVDGDGDITITLPFTGLTASVAVPWVSYWSASTGGTYLGKAQNSSGDAGANAAGALTFTAIENTTAS